MKYLIALFAILASPALADTVTITCDSTVQVTTTADAITYTCKKTAIVIPAPTPPVACAGQPTGALLPNGQQFFVTLYGTMVQSYLLPDDSRTVKVTKWTDTPREAKPTMWFSRCPGVIDDVTKGGACIQTFLNSGGNLKYTRGPGDTEFCSVPSPAYVNFKANMTAPYVLQRSQ